MCESHPYVWAKDLLESFGTVLLNDDDTFSFKCEDESFRTYLLKLYCTLRCLRGGRRNDLYQSCDLVVQFIELLSKDYDLLDTSLMITTLFHDHLLMPLGCKVERVMLGNYDKFQDAIKVIIKIYHFIC